IRDLTVTGVQTCALPISKKWRKPLSGCCRAKPATPPCPCSTFPEGADEHDQILLGRPAARLGARARLDQRFGAGDQGLRGAVRRSEERRVGKECRSGWSS